MSIYTDARNELLARLPDAESERLQARMRPVTLDFKQLLYQAGKPIESVYFLTGATVSALTTLVIVCFNAVDHQRRRSSETVAPVRK